MNDDLDRLPDLELLRRAIAGDEDAWAILVDRHCSRIRRFFMGTVPPERVDDLTQETFARLLKVLTSGVEIKSFIAFLLGIAKNVLREYVRERKRDPRLELSDISAVDLDPRASTMLVRHAEQLLLLEGLRRLTLEHQIVLMFSYWDDLTSREIAEVMEENENTVRGRITRAREKLAEHVAELERNGPPGPPGSKGFEDWAHALRRMVAERDDTPDDDDE